MASENIFTKLRSLGTTVENETARLEENMKKPIGLRTSGEANRKPSQLIFKEMLNEAQNVKSEARQKLGTLKSEGQDFKNIVDAVQSLIQVQRQQIHASEEYLQQYGYIPYKQYQEHPASKAAKKAAKANGKENVPQPEQTEPSAEAPANDAASTPSKENQPSEADVKEAAGSRTPQLADFGMSQAALDMLARMKMPTNSPGRSDRTYNITQSTNGASCYPPMTTPQCQPPMMTPMYQHSMPFAQDTVKVTPGLFNYRTIPDNTPEHFIDKGLPGRNMEDSPIPPVLSTVKKWPKSSSHMAPPPAPNFDCPDEDVTVTNASSTPHTPEAPQLTFRWKEFIPVAPQLHHTSNPASTGTPPMPEFQSTASSSTVPHEMPTRPVLLADRLGIAPTMPVEPVQLASQMQRGDEMPARPVLLADKLGIGPTMPDEMPARPVLLADKLGIAPTLPDEMPARPVLLADKLGIATTMASEMPSRPVLLADKLGIAPTMPAEPVRLASQMTSNLDTPPPPVLLTQRFGASHYIPAPQQSQETPATPIPPSSSSSNHAAHQPLPPNANQHHPQVTMATAGVSMTTSGLPSGVTPQKPPSVMRLQNIDDGMPKTPELTMNYKRFVDINKAPVASVQPTPMAHYGQHGPQGAGQGEARSGTGMVDQVGQRIQGTGPCQISHISPQEFVGVQDYLQRILPLNVINSHINTINQILTCKEDSSYITEEETKIVDLGAQQRVMLLLLCKLQRWKKGKSPITNEPAYFIM